MTKTFAYATPEIVDDPANCFFYHCMHIPGVGEVGQQWDLRDAIDGYLGQFDFRGQRVLDVGTASGFLTFEMEKRGAEVVSFDMDEGLEWDIVPHHTIQPDFDAVRQRMSQRHQKLRRGYWFAHQRLGSRAQAYYGNVYDLPAELGEFDVVVFGMVLSHLRDPFQALYSASRLCRGTIIVTNQMSKSDDAVGHFIPSQENQELIAWWGFSKVCLAQMLGILGFEVNRAIESYPQCVVKNRNGTEACTALVAQRVAGASILAASTSAGREKAA